MSKESRALKRQQGYEDFLVEQYADIDWPSFRATESYLIELGHMKEQDRMALPPNVLVRLGIVELGAES
jgi:hypothetical protein